MKKRVFVTAILSLIVLIFSACEGKSNNNSDIDTPGILQDPTSEPTFDPSRASGGYSPNENNDEIYISIDWVTVTDKLQLKTIDYGIYAEAKSFIEIFTDADISITGYRHYNYEFFEDKNEIYISSWTTGEAIYSMFIDSTTVYEYLPADLNSDNDYKILEMDEVPRIIGEDVYIPVKAFRDISGHRIVAKHNLMH